jgi:exonuclease III
MLGVEFDKNYIFLPSLGASGGVLIAWRARLGTVSSSREDTFSISVQFSPSDGTPWWLTCVYGPQENQEKIQFLQELREIRSLCAGPWLVAGDFNLIYRDEDKNNSNLNRAMMGRFRRWVNDMAVTELPLHGRKYTWSSSSTSSSPTLVRLDRVFCSLEWEELFPDCLLHSRPSGDSDHCPLLLGLQDRHVGKRRFHFEAFWPSLEGFLVTVEAAWTSVPARSCPLQTLSQKFKATSRSLQSWSQKSVGHLNSQLFLAKEVLHQLEIAQDFRMLSANELWLRNKLKKHTLGLASLLRTVARVRSRINWLQDGDANTRLFHMHARHRKRKNFIASLREGDQLLTSHEEKAAAIYDFYSNLIGADSDRDRTINLECLDIPNHNLEALESPFSEEEVWQTIKDLPSDKAPGPDGFTGRFYKACWPIIKGDIMAALLSIWGRNCRNLWRLNSAYITLLPKKTDAEMVKDFRPISLVHSFAKLVTKILANRLAGRLNDMVSPNQSAFIKKRFIQDNFMMVQQTVKYLHSQKQPRILLKLDITKAFDSVSWPFLLEVLRKLGFGPRWRDLVCGLLASSSTQVLLNGAPGDFIQHRRGLRQGDPLSPMLFILVMDVLNWMVSRASEAGLLQPLSSRPIQHRISLYADDVAIFLRPIAADINLTLQLLQLFGDASGLKTNVQKSNVMPIQCAQEELAIIHNLLPCEVLNFPCKYLGLPLSIKKLTKEQFQPIIDRIADQLPGWKADLMTRAGRAVLVQFVLTAMLVYVAMAIELPTWAIKAIDKIRRGFLWRGRKEANGGHCLIAWQKVCRLRELGGLGLSDLKRLSCALRARWLWLKKTEPNKPWANLPIQVSKEVECLIYMAVITEVGDGTNTLFWKDKWLEGHSIRDLAPRVYALVSNRRIGKRTVREALTDGKWLEDIQGFISADGLVEFLKIWDLLSLVELQEGTPDKHIWRISSSGVYSAKSAYEILFQGAVYFRPALRIWKSHAPPKCRFFMWLVAHNRCWTADRLARRGLPHPAKCVLCDQEEEDIQHLMVGCVFARQVWFSLLRRVRLSQLAPQPQDIFDDWWERVEAVVSDDLRKGVNSLIILGAWSIWRHRNDCVFNGSSPSVAAVLALASVEGQWWRLAGARGLTFSQGEG